MSLYIVCCIRMYLLCDRQQCPMLVSTSDILIPTGHSQTINVNAVNLPTPRVRSDILFRFNVVDPA